MHGRGKRPAEQLTLRLLATGTAVAVLLGAGHGAHGWSAPRFVSADGWSGTDSPNVAVDRQGDALLVWEACDERTPACYHQVQARLRSRRGALGPIMNLSKHGPAVAWPQIDTDDDGDALVVWLQHDTHTNWRVAARRVSRTGGLGPILMLTPDTAIANNPSVAVAPQGHALVVWSETRNGSWHMVAQRVFPNNRLGPRLELGAGSPEFPAVAMDRRGTAVAVWTEFSQVLARRMTRSGMSAARSIVSGSSPRGGFAMVRVAVDRDGDAVISFRSAAGAHPRVFARQWRRDGRLGRLLAVSPPAHVNGFHHTLAGDLEGDAVVAWTRMLPDDRIELHGRHISRSGTLGPIARFGRGDLADATVDDDGDGVVAWHAPDDDVQEEARARSIRRSGGFGPVRKLAPGGRVPQVGASPTGAVVAIWQLKDYPYRIQTAFEPVR